MRAHLHKRGRRALSWALSCALLALAACGDDLPPGLGTDLGFSAIVFAQRAAPAHAGDLTGVVRFFPGGNVVLLDPAAPAGRKISLTGLAAGDVQGLAVAPDGASAIAAVRTSPDDRFHLVEVRLERDAGPCFLESGDLGPACRQLSFGPADDVEPFFLPDGRVAFTRLDPDGPMDVRGRGLSRRLWAVELDGTGAALLDVEPGHVLGASQLPDGRVYAIRWMETGAGMEYRPVSLDPMGVSGVVPDGPAAPEDSVPLGPIQFEDGRRVAACVPAFLAFGAGTACQRTSEGEWRGIVAGMPEGYGCSPEGRLRDPVPIKDGRLLAAYARVPNGCMNATDETREIPVDFSLAVIDPASGERVPLGNTPGLADVFPRPVAPRSLLDPGVSLPPRPEKSCAAGGVLFEGFVGAKALTQGAVRLRVLSALSGGDVPWRVELGAASGAAICAGDSDGNGAPDTYEVPVYADGSFRFRGPADTPLRLQILDRYGAALAADPWWRGGPACAVRQCAGCHANDGHPSGLDGSQAYAAPEGRLDAPAAGRRSFDYVRDIQPILNRSCVASGCHDTATRAGAYVDLSGNLVGLDLTGAVAGISSRSYQTLLWVDALRDPQSGRVRQSRAAFVVPGWAARSRLMQKLGAPCRYECAGQAAWAPWGMGGASRHPEDRGGAYSLSDEERQRILEWLESGAPFVRPGAAP